MSLAYRTFSLAALLIFTAFIYASNAFAQDSSLYNPLPGETKIVFKPYDFVIGSLSVDYLQPAIVELRKNFPETAEELQRYVFKWAPAVVPLSFDKNFVFLASSCMTKDLPGGPLMLCEGRIPGSSKKIYIADVFFDSSNFQ